MASEQKLFIPPSLLRCQNCGKESKLQCPTCIKLNIAPSRFCSQECFKKSWTDHNKIHKEAQEFITPSFPYTGTLRPHYVTPMRTVPDYIEKPEYWITGNPESETALRLSSKIHINSKEEIEGIREACRIGREVLDIAASIVQAGITTEEIDRIVHEATIERNAYPSPLNYRHFPKSCCTSVNEVICHGIPDARMLQDGDIVNIDISVYYKGFHGDLNETYLVGNVDEHSKSLVKSTYEALDFAIKHARPGVPVKEFGEIITKHVKKHGFEVVRTYCGHGVGRLFHAPPNVPHYAKNKAVGILKPGMVFTIEPMINMGTWMDTTWLDDWTSVTQDGKRSAQFEHTLLITDSGCEVLTARTSKSKPLFWEVNPTSPTYISTSTSTTSTESSDEKKKHTELQTNKEKKMKDDVKQPDATIASVSASSSSATPIKEEKNKKKKKKRNK